MASVAAFTDSKAVSVLGGNTSKDKESPSRARSSDIFIAEAFQDLEFSYHYSTTVLI
jgi:hypothetical protein